MKVFKLIALLLDYPTDESLNALNTLVNESHSALTLVAGLDTEDLFSPEEREELANFVEQILRADRDALQAEYVQTFDLTAEHSLHLTHHLFGEEKSRGPALIDLGEFYAAHGLECDKRELPDYLPMMLEFASEITPEESKVFLGEIGKVLKVLADNLEAGASRYAPLVRIVERQSGLVRLAS